MDTKQIIRGLKDWVKREKGIDFHLNACQEAILEYSLQNIAYANMDNLGYAVDTIKNNTGPDLFKRLSEVTDRKVSKKNCFLTLPRLLEHPSSEEDTENNLLRIDLREAPVPKDFYGRVEELSKLETWIVKEHCPLVGVFGMGGIGKTPLLRKFKDLIDYLMEHDPKNIPQNTQKILWFIQKIKAGQKQVILPIPIVFFSFALNFVFLTLLAMEVTLGIGLKVLFVVVLCVIGGFLFLPLIKYLL